MKKAILILFSLFLSGLVMAGTVGDRPGKPKRPRTGSKLYVPVVKNDIRCYLSDVETLHFINGESIEEKGSESLRQAYQKCYEREGIVGLYGCGFGSSITYHRAVNKKSTSDIDSKGKNMSFVFSVKGKGRVFRVAGKRKDKVGKRARRPDLLVHLTFTGKKRLTTNEVELGWQHGNGEISTENVTCYTESPEKLQEFLDQ